MSQCRSCQAQIEWAVTEKGSRIPLDISTPVGKGNINTERVGSQLIARVVKTGEGVRISHFATCPKAAKHRTRQPKPEQQRFLP